MSDADLRELERRFRASGSVEDEAAWLRARVQAGELSPERLELAAHCGHEASRSFTGGDSPEAIGRWGAGLVRWGRPPVLRAVVSALDYTFASLPALELTDVVPEDLVESAILPRALWTLRVMDDWILSPSDRTRKMVSKSDGGLARAIDRLQQELRRLRREDPYPGHYPEKRLTSRERSVLAGAWGARRSIQVVTSNAPDQLEAVAANAVGEAVLAAEGLGVGQGRDIASRELVPWALGYGDPVRERVEARQRAEAARE